MKFERISSKVVPLDIVNVDTDQIIPKQFLKLIDKTGFGQFLFYDWRYNSDGSPKKDFILNDPGYASRQILLTRDNFGSGSSREHAAWALRDYGFSAIIAPSFADIFYNNCIKNGILPVAIDSEEIDHYFSKAQTLIIDIDLASQKIIADGHEIVFHIDPFDKKMLIEGLDGIEITLELSDEITNYEKKFNNGFKISI